MKLPAAAPAILSVALVLCSFLPFRVGRTSVATLAAPIGTTEVLAGETPQIVRSGAAVLAGMADALASMSVDITLPLRNRAGLDAFIADKASRGIYLTQAQFDEQFAPLADQVSAVESWGAEYGLTTTYASADGTTITLRGTTGALGRALGVQFNTYHSAQYGTFRSAASDPIVPADLGISAIVGLDTIPRFHALSQRAQEAQMEAVRARAASAGPPYIPSDFRSIYDVGHGFDATGQLIGLTLWGAPLPQSDLNNFATATHDITITATGVYSGTKPTGTAPDQIDWVYTNGVDTSTNVQDETAMDVEYAHGMAPHSHLVYYLGDTLADGISGDEVGLENAISLAANNSLIHVVSNSWGGADITSLSDPFASSTDQSLEQAVAVGTTFFFSTGDWGSDLSSSTPRQAQYPASSPYVMAVGGTTLQTDGSDHFQGETVWSTCGAAGNCSGMQGAGAGCSAFYAQPVWENIAAVRAEESKEQGIAHNYCTTVRRFEPDVSADADPTTGANVYVFGSHFEVGGTSLATPLWAGMAAMANAYALSTGQPSAVLGWAAPKIYALASSPVAYRSDYHDVTQGATSGLVKFPADTNWDEATGWGSIDWWYFVCDVVGSTSGCPLHRSIPVAAGWNLVTLPLMPTTALTADNALSDLLQSTGGAFAEIAAYGGGQWSQTRYDDLSGGLGHGGSPVDFTLAVGQGYALYSDRSGSLPIEGSTAPSQQWPLQAGWNLVGLPLGTSPAAAYSLLDTLLGTTGGSFAEIDGLAGGTWAPGAHASRSGSSLANGSRDFTVQPGQACAVFTDMGTTLTALAARPLV